MGAANLYVAFNFSEKIWATFKLFGGMGLMFVFVVAQSLILTRYMQDEQQ
jgi:intracellular septation protein